MEKLIGKLTYANVMATIAVFIALGGAGYAATNLAKNSVGSAQIKKEAVGAAKIKNGAITGAKIKRGAVTGADINLGTLGTVPSATSAAHAGSADNATHAAAADTAANATTLDGKAASAFAASSVIRSALIERSGTIVASKSTGIAQANLDTSIPGVLCFKGLDPAPVSAVATVGFGADPDSRVFVETNGPFGCQVEIETRSDVNTRAPEPVQVMVH